MKDSESTGLFNTGYAFKVCIIINTLDLFSPYTTHACTVCAAYNTNVLCAFTVYATYNTYMNCATEHCTTLTHT